MAQKTFLAVIIPHIIKKEILFRAASISLSTYKNIIAVLFNCTLISNAFLTNVSYWFESIIQRKVYLISANTKYIIRMFLLEPEYVFGPLQVVNDLISVAVCGYRRYKSFRLIIAFGAQAVRTLKIKVAQISVGHYSVPL